MNDRGGMDARLCGLFRIQQRQRLREVGPRLLRLNDGAIARGGKIRRGNEASCLRVEARLEIFWSGDESEIVRPRVTERGGRGNLAIAIAAKAQTETGGEFGCSDQRDSLPGMSAIRSGISITTPEMRGGGMRYTAVNAIKTVTQITLIRITLRNSRGVMSGAVARVRFKTPNATNVSVMTRTRVKKTSRIEGFIPRPAGMWKAAIVRNSSISPGSLGGVMFPPV